MRNLEEQVKKVFSYQKLIWPFTAWINCSRNLKSFANSLTSASNFKIFSQSLEQFFLTVGQNNFGNKIPFLLYRWNFWMKILILDYCVLSGPVGTFFKRKSLMSSIWGSHRWLKKGSVSFLSRIVNKKRSFKKLHMFFSWFFEHFSTNKIPIFWQ